MKRPRSRTSKRGYQLTPDAGRILQENRPAPFTLTPKGVAFVADCKSKLGAIAENENLPRSTKIDVIIAEISAPKPAPAACWDCGCTSIEVATVGNYPPAYICALCDLWLGDVNPIINVTAELTRKYEDLILKLNHIPLSDEPAFAETLELIQLIRAEILRLESK